MDVCTGGLNTGKKGFCVFLFFFFFFPLPIEQPCSSPYGLCPQNVLGLQLLYVPAVKALTGFALGACCLLGDAPVQARDVTEALGVLALPPA